jgi:RloB-like protein
VRDNQPKHRQMRKEQGKLARQRASREGLPAVLIVCEGRETEPNYIQGLMEQLGVNAAAVRIERGGSRTDPVSLVKAAQKMFKDDGGFDLVYVVCDGDSNRLIEARRHAEKTLVNSARQKASVRIVATSPSIEFWLLLHFEYSTREFQNSEEVQRELQAHLPDYQKNHRDIFTKVRTGLDRAHQHAERLKAELRATGASRPDTDFPILVEQLSRMSRRN